ncbi:MAG: hypothetical protein NTU58_01435 [Candidatus Nealsonbacteria bacterium]|nr:hypothetical protein [Candidatus Nealsonbacteria bacterium]
MQLIKDDIKTYHICDYCGTLFPLNAEGNLCSVCEIGHTSKTITVINLDKLQQVVEFYEKYKYTYSDEESVSECLNKLKTEQPKVFEKWKKETDYNDSMMSFNDWFFNYCFKDGFK